MAETTHLIAHLEQLRRSIVMAPDRSVVTLHRDDVADLLELTLDLARRARTDGV
jgi:hypothetical protein